MSWLREPVYAWGDGYSVHLWARRDSVVEAFDPNPRRCDPEESDYPGFTGGLAMPQAVFDALVLYRHAELAQDPKQMRRAVKAAKKYAGNVGSYAFLESIGRDPRSDFRKRMDKAGEAK